MNRIIVIGNGFDLAHGLKTGYQDFINDYWEQVSSTVFGNTQTSSNINNLLSTYLPQNHSDEFISISCRQKWQTPSQEHPQPLFTWQVVKKTAYTDFAQKVDAWNQNSQSAHFCVVTFKNHFFERLTQQLTLQNWVDIENAYYKELTALLHESNEEQRKMQVRTLNQEFEAVKKRLEAYLSKVIQTTKPRPIDSIDDAFRSPIYQKEIAHSKQDMVYESIYQALDAANDISIVAYDEPSSEQTKDWNYDMCKPAERHQYIVKDQWEKQGDNWEYAKPKETLLLNFNYTNTTKLYSLNWGTWSIAIHGRLNNPYNPIIFGYGDELDDHYLAIEKLQDNEFLRNIKSMWYLETDNYRQLLEFIESDPYQVFIMGHSCGNSDRTLLNTLFEHHNCFSIKAFYHQKTEHNDDYNSVVCNISRNFNNKAAMRTIVVNHPDSWPLVPWNQQNHENK